MFVCGFNVAVEPIRRAIVVAPIPCRVVGIIANKTPKQI